MNTAHAYNGNCTNAITNENVPKRSPVYRTANIPPGKKTFAGKNEPCPPSAQLKEIANVIKNKIAPNSCNSKKWRIFMILSFFSCCTKISVKTRITKTLIMLRQFTMAKTSLTFCKIIMLSHVVNIYQHMLPRQPDK
jgi:hypothetical protein